MPAIYGVFSWGVTGVPQGLFVANVKNTQLNSRAPLRDLVSDHG